MIIFKNLKIYSKLYILIIIFIFAFFFTSTVLAGPLEQKGRINTQTEAFQTASGFTTDTTVGGVIAMVIQAFLGLLGIIFIILIITAGYNWMTAGGNEEKVTKAKDTLSRAVIGLIIVISAYAITYFVFTNLPAVGDGGPNVI